MATATQRATFLATMAPIAVKQAKLHDGKIYPSVCLAQAIHESDWGTSKKMARANAVFGIKVGKSAWHFGKAWDGSAYNTMTTEYYDAAKKVATRINDWFRAYKDLESATEDYMDMLCTCSRYRKALGQNSPKRCIEEIVAGGYATGPNYANAIMQIISVYNLTKYDAEDYESVNPYSLYSKIMKRGFAGESVKWLQWELTKRGADLIIDGKFGKITEEKVKIFQEENNLVPDGICGPKTIEKLKK